MTQINGLLGLFARNRFPIKIHCILKKSIVLLFLHKSAHFSAIKGFALYFIVEMGHPVEVYQNFYIIKNIETDKIELMPPHSFNVEYQPTEKDAL